MTSESIPDLSGKVALVTGAGRGLGRVLALALARAGAYVAANDLTPILLDETIRRVQAAGGQAQPYLADIAKGMPARALVNEVVEEHGRLDILVNNAGVRPDALLQAMDEWDWQRTLDVNLSGPFLLMQAAVRPMQAAGGGVILNLGSERLTPELAEGHSAYFATKAGLEALTAAAAIEFLPYNIRVHMIRPGSYPPPATEPNTGESTRLVDPPPAAAQALARLALYLCSPQAAGLSGQIFHLDDPALLQEDRQA